MRLTRRFAIALTCAILAVLGISALVLIRREVAVFEQDTRRDHLVLARGLARTARYVLPLAGAPAVREMIERADARWANIDVRWVDLDDPPSRLDAPNVPVTELEPRLSVDEHVALYREEEPDGEVLYSYFRVDEDRAHGAVELREPLAEQRAHLRRTIVLIAMTTLALVVACGGLALGLGTLFVGRPMRLLIRQARRIGRGELSERLDVRQRDEIGELAHEMNTMCDQLATANERATTEAAARLDAVNALRHADRLTTIGKLATGVAHELGTPLNIIIGRAQLIQSDSPAGGGVHDHAGVIARQGQRAAAIIRQLLDFARRRPLHKAPRDVAALARHAVEMLRPIADRAGTALVVAGEGSAIASIDDGHFEQALTNLIINGIQAAPGGTVTVSVKTTRAARPSTGERPVACICITVEDDGTGIKPEDLQRVFEPFFTTKEVGEGTGLGLSVTHGIVEDHGGWVEVASEVGRGASFTVCVPQEAA